MASRNPPTPRMRRVGGSPCGAGCLAAGDRRQMLRFLFVLRTVGRNRPPLVKCGHRCRWRSGKLKIVSQTIFLGRFCYMATRVLVLSRSKRRHTGIIPSNLESYEALDGLRSQFVCVHRPTSVVGSHNTCRCLFWGNWKFKAIVKFSDELFKVHAAGGGTFWETVHPGGKFLRIGRLCCRRGWKDGTLKT